MANEIAPKLSSSNQAAVRPRITSYDSEYDYSFDHYVDIKLLLQDADKDLKDMPATYAGPF